MQPAFTFRAAQLDLARQMETMDFIKEFMTFVAKRGFTTLLLYLEGRIKTPAFPYMADDQSYSPDQIKELVAYAKELNLEVVPALNGLGHAEMFLQFEELHPLAELREPDCEGRFNEIKNVLCPSNPDTLTFIKSYFSQVSALFPAKLLHVGLDEVWDLGFCSTCKAHIQKGGAPADLFEDYLLALHQFVTQDLHKEMGMWDDMLEEYPSVQKTLPSDIWLFVWQYDAMIDDTKSHFGVRKRDHRILNYKDKGHPVVMAPWDKNLSNVETITHYARPYKPHGALVTAWERKDSFYYRHLPMFAWAGRAWSLTDTPVDDDKIFAEICEDLFGVTDYTFVSAAKLACTAPFWGKAPSRAPLVLTYPTAYAKEREESNHLLTATLSGFADRVKDSGKPILEDLITHYQLEMAGHQTLTHMACLLPQHPPLSKTDADYHLHLCQSGLQQLTALTQKRETQWQRWRGTLTPIGTTLMLEDFMQRTQALLEDIKHKDITNLKTRWFLPHSHGLPKVKLMVKQKGSWQVCYEGVPKPLVGDYSEHQEYTRLIPVKGGLPETLKVEVCGYGQIGLMFVKAIHREGVHIPTFAQALSGQVDSPENVLTDHTHPVWLGQPDTDDTFGQSEDARVIHGLEVTLSPG